MQKLLESVSQATVLSLAQIKLFSIPIIDWFIVYFCLQAAITKYHIRGSLKYKHLFLTNLQAKKSKIKVLAESVSGESPASWFIDG